MKDKREFLRVALSGIAAVCVAAWRGHAQERGKMTKQQASYQDSPNGIAMCATCTFFIAPQSCKLVEGDISPNGWCTVYAMAD